MLVETVIWFLVPVKGISRPKNELNVIEMLFLIALSHVVPNP